MGSQCAIRHRAESLRVTIARVTLARVSIRPPKRAAAVVACFAAVTTSAFAATLTDRNSVEHVLEVDDRVEIRGGPGCGAPATAAASAPATATDVRVLEPKIGDRDDFVRVTDVRVDGTQIRVSAVSEDPDVCREGWDWRGSFEVRGTYRKRIRTVLRTSTGFPRKYGVSPRTLLVSFYDNDRVVRLKWSRFGSKRATGRGVMKEGARRGVPCTRLNCPLNNKRVTVVADRPGACASRTEPVFEYRRVSIFVKSRRVMAYENC